MPQPVRCSPRSHPLAWPPRRYPADPLGHQHMVARVCAALAPVCRSLSATPLHRLLPRYNGDGLCSAGLPQIRPSAATMCFSADSSDALRVPGLARRVCSACAASLHAGRRPAESWSIRLCRDRLMLCSAASLMMSPTHRDTMTTVMLSNIHVF
jgi:hypothetical protein